MEFSRSLAGACIIPELASRDRDGVLAELSAAVARVDPRLRQERVFAALRERESLGSTGIGDGVAIPHGKSADAAGLVIAFARSSAGVPFDALDGRDVHFFFALLAPEDPPEQHLKTLARISRLLRDPDLRSRLAAAAGASEILKVLQEGEHR